jgi:hypothetical protein
MPSKAVQRIILGDRYYNAVSQFKSETTGYGILSLFDFVWFTAAPSVAKAVIPVIGSSAFPLTLVGGVNFTANRGFTGNGTTGYLDTNFPPSSGVNFIQDSACLCAYTINSRAVVSTGALMGANTNGAARPNYIVPYNTGGAFGACNSSAITYAASPNANGFWHVNRSGANSNQMYRNGSSVATAATSSATRATSSFVILADRQGASAAVTDFSIDTVSAVLIGASLDATQSANLSTAVNNYMKTFGINAY